MDEFELNELGSTTEYNDLEIIHFIGDVGEELSFADGLERIAKYAMSLVLGASVFFLARHRRFSFSEVFGSVAAVVFIRWTPEFTLLSSF